VTCITNYPQAQIFRLTEYVVGSNIDEQESNPRVKVTLHIRALTARRKRKNEAIMGAFGKKRPRIYL
jgi:hypothetical protein